MDSSQQRSRIQIFHTLRGIHSFFTFSYPKSVHLSRHRVLLFLSRYLQIACFDHKRLKIDKVEQRLPVQAPNFVLFMQFFYSNPYRSLGIFHQVYQRQTYLIIYFDHIFVTKQKFKRYQVLKFFNNLFRMFSFEKIISIQRPFLQ